MNINNKLHKFLFWFLSYTWGIIMTLIGSFVAVFLLITGHKPRRFGWDVCFLVGKYWGGLSFGPFILTDSLDNYSVKCHEHGHSLQNIVLGPLFPFLVGIPSSLRYWVRKRPNFESKYRFAMLVATILIGLSAIGLIVSVLSNIPITYSTIFCSIFTALLAYTSILSLWLIEEVNKYEDGKEFPLYDDFYPEGDATKRGTKFIENEKRS